MSRQRSASRERERSPKTSPRGGDNNRSDKTWATIKDGKINIGDTGLQVDIPAMCTALGVKQSEICPTLVVQASNKQLPNCQARCPTPDLPGHRTTTDWAHAKSLKLRDKYWTISKDVSKRSKQGKKRPQTDDERGTSKRFRSNTEGDGPLGWGRDRHHPDAEALTAVVIVELFSGICSLSSPMVEMHTPQHEVSLMAFSEMLEHSRAFALHMHPHAEDWGAYSDSMHTSLEQQPSVVATTFDCAPYALCGKRQMHKDARSSQVGQSIDFVIRTAPHLLLVENVEQFFTKDAVHGLVTYMHSRLQPTMRAHPTVMMYDGHLGGGASPHQRFQSVGAATGLFRATSSTDA